MNELIEDYLRAAGVRYFRGHHDDDFFYLVDVPGGVHRGRLHVHLEVGGVVRDAVRISISPDRFFPAQYRERLTELAARWNAGEPCVYAVVHDSCDPALVGGIAQITHRPAGIEGLTGFVDHAVASAAELFALMRAVAGAEVPEAVALRDAG
ncbi:MAG: hypothetical protein ACR2JM_06485 [Mycobacterium sp.]